MSDSYTRSEQINELATSLALAQAEMDNASKDKVNAYFKGAKYADLASVRAACFPALNKHGIAVFQPVRVDGTRVFVTTLLVHKSGQWMGCEVSAQAYEGQKDNGTQPSDKAQPVGSCITYLRRYGLSAMVGVAPAEDDGEAAMGRTGPRTVADMMQQKPASEEDELVWLKKLAEAKDNAEKEKIAAEITAASKAGRLSAEAKTRLRAAYDVCHERLNPAKKEA